MKNPFKKKQRAEKTQEKAPEAPKPTVIQTVQGYKLDGVFYDTVEAAKIAYVKKQLKALTITYWSGGSYFDEGKVENNLAAIKALVNEELKVEPLQPTINSVPTYVWSGWNDSTITYTFGDTPKGKKK